MAAGRRGALTAVAVMVAALAPLLLAGVARADCFDYCFKNCIANDKSMTDYCNYACDKTCSPGAPQRPLAVAADDSDIGCQLSCARTSCNRLGPDCKAVETCFGQCYDGCKTKPLPRPLRAGAGGSVSAASGPIFRSSEPDKDDAAIEKHPFHEKQDGVQPSSSEPDKDEAATEKHPFHEKKDGVRPSSSEPDKDDAATQKHPFHEKQDGVRPSSSEPDKDDAATQKRPFHEKQDGVQPSSSEPDRDDAATEKQPFHEKQDGARPSSSGPDKDDAATEKHPFHEKQDGVRPSSSEPDKDDAVQPWLESPDTDAARQPGKASSSLNCNFHEKQDGVQPASEQQLTPLSKIHAAPPAPL